MPTDRPNAAELIEAVREFLDGDIAPGLDGRNAFQMRVALNMLAVVERTLHGGGAMDAAEQARLQALLAADGDLDDLNRKLAAMIGAGNLDDRSDEVLDHLRQTATDKLKLVNPRYIPAEDD